MKPRSDAIIPFNTYFHCFRKIMTSVTTIKTSVTIIINSVITIMTYCSV
jgi:hypothetical protein